MRRKAFLIFILFLSIIISIGFIWPGPQPSPKSINPNLSITLDWDINFTNNGEDFGHDIVLDDLGNIYVTGEERNNTKGNTQIFIGQFNQSRHQKWRVNRGGALKDVGSSISIDSLNNLYIAGYTQNTTNDYDIILLKYSKNGEYQWNKTWGGDSYDLGRGITVDQMGNIYIVGSTTTTDAWEDSIFLKFDNTGSLIWNISWGNLNIAELSYAIKIDSEGNFYITGYRETSMGILLKYNNTGSLIWTRSWSGTYGFHDLAIDSNDNIYVVGGNLDINIRKYSKDGAILWSRTYNSGEGDAGSTITLDPGGNVYLGGYINYKGGSTPRNPCILKYSNDGVFLWEYTYEDNIDGNILGLSSDLNFNIYATGNIKGLLGDQDILILKYLPDPGPFLLNSDAEPLDPNGSFNLYWTESIDADNYTLYQYNKPISTINSSLIEIIKGNTNRTYNFNNLSERAYYFITVAFNIFGNSSSNCLKVVVQYPPEEFVLYENPENPEMDGIVNLTWSSSKGTDNYSLYFDDTYISIIDGGQSLIAEGLNQTNFLITNLQNGDYFYAVLAINEAGHTLSNCINFRVLRKPSKFNLTSFAGSPDLDGKFELKWTYSEFADNYTVFRSSNYITVINDTVEIVLEFTPQFHWPSYRYEISNSPTGVYYFKVIAFNQYGNTSTNCHKVTVERLPEMELYLPIENEMFEENPPSFNIWINKTNIHKMWYILNSNTTKHFFTKNETINFNSWSRLQDGFITITFFANTTDGYRNSKFVIVKKDTCTPKIFIISPEQGQFFNQTVPYFVVDINDPFLDKMWYSFNGGQNYTFTENTTFNAIEWINFPHGDITITFYANDTYGHIFSKSILIKKDLEAPNSTIIFNPYLRINVVNKSTLFLFSADDGQGSGVSLIQYKINNSNWIKYSAQFNLSDFPYGHYLITYQAIDIVGNIELENSIAIDLVEIPSIEPSSVIPGYSLYVLLGIIGISLVILKKNLIKK